MNLAGKNGDYNWQPVLSNLGKMRRKVIRALAGEDKTGRWQEEELSLGKADIA